MSSKWLLKKFHSSFVCQALAGWERNWKLVGYVRGWEEKEKRNFWKFTADRVAGPSGGEDCHENLCYLISKEEKEKKNRKINRFSLKRNILPAMKANLGGIQEGNNAAGSLRVHYLIPFKVLLEPARRLHCMSGWFRNGLIVRVSWCRDWRSGGERQWEEETQARERKIDGEKSETHSLYYSSSLLVDTSCVLQSVRRVSCAR